MKRISSISLATFYLLISMGVGLQLHFCGDLVADVDLYAQSSEMGCCTEKEADVPKNECANNGCCHNEAIVFQSSTETLPKSQSFSFNTTPVQAVKLSSKLVNIEWILRPLVEQGKYFYSPPSSSMDTGKALRLSYCSLVYYA